MAAAAISLPSLTKTRKRFDFRKNSALSFIDSIESTWKGHEEFAFWLVQHFRPKTIVDLGFDRGLSTLAFAYRNRGHVFGIDWFDEGNYATKCIALDSAFRNISNAIRFHYAKNIHLIVGHWSDVLKNWTRKIDILHIDWAHSYAAAKHRYENWSRFLQLGGVVLIHDVIAFPSETGRFFDELPLYKMVFPHAHGLGVASHKKELIADIQSHFKEKFFVK